MDYLLRIALCSNIILWASVAFLIWRIWQLERGFERISIAVVKDLRLMGANISENTKSYNELLALTKEFTTTMNDSFRTVSHEVIEVQNRLYALEEKVSRIQADKKPIRRRMKTIDPINVVIPPRKDKADERTTSKRRNARATLRTLPR